MEKMTLNIYMISRSTHNFYARELRKLNITMGQFPFIMTIAANDGISQEKLSAELKISKSTTAVIVRQLLEADLATREIDERDRRNFKLHATGKSLSLIPKIEAIINRCHQEITKDLTDIERNIFANLLEKVQHRAADSLGRKKAEL